MPPFRPPTALREYRFPQISGMGVRWRSFLILVLTVLGAVLESDPGQRIVQDPRHFRSKPRSRNSAW